MKIAIIGSSSAIESEFLRQFTPGMMKGKVDEKIYDGYTQYRNINSAQRVLHVR